MPEQDTTAIETEVEKAPQSPAPAKEQLIDIGSPLPPSATAKPITPKPEEDDEDNTDRDSAEADDAKKENDALVAQTFADMLESIGEGDVPPPAPEDDTEDKKKPEDKPADSAPADDKKPVDEKPADGAEKPAETPKKVVKFELPKELTDDEPAQPATAAAPAAPRQPAPSTTPDPDADYIAGLPQDVRDEIEAASIAERMLGDKYSGHKKKLVGWLKGVDSEIERLRKDNPERSFGQDDTEYQSRLAELRKSKPVISRQDEREIERRIIRSEVKEEVLQELHPKITEVDRKTKAIELKPKVAATAQKFAEHITNMISGHSPTLKPIMEDAAKLGEKAREHYALEMDIIDERTNVAKELMSEYLMVKNGASKIDPNNLTQTQSELNQFLVTQGNEFAKTGGKKLIDAQGRKFIPNHQMNSIVRQVRDGTLSESELSKYWTFNDEMILGMLAVKAVVEIEAGVRYETERSKKYGFERKPRAATEPAKPAESPKPTPPVPKSRPRPTIGGGQRPVKSVAGEEHITSIAGDLGID